MSAKGTVKLHVDRSNAEFVASFLIDAYSAEEDQHKPSYLFAKKLLKATKRKRKHREFENNMFTTDFDRVQATNVFRYLSLYTHPDYLSQAAPYLDSILHEKIIRVCLAIAVSLATKTTPLSSHDEAKRMSKDEDMDSSQRARMKKRVRAEEIQLSQSLTRFYSRVVVAIP